MAKIKTKAQHTPGPWTVDDGDKVWGAASCSDGPRCEMCRPAVAIVLCDDPGATYDADARLIAAAPDLLEAARAIMAWADCSAVNHNSQRTESIEAMRAAIAKAEGR